MVCRDTIPTWGDHRFARIGLLGGSFNPAHLGHQTIARRALGALGLDQVWLMVSPGNPLKPAAGMAPFARRLASAATLADGRRLIATDIEARLGTRYTFDTLGKLQTRFPNVHFVWLTGADGFVTLPKWKGWKRLLHRVPVAVMPRPGQNMQALRGAAAHYLAHYRLPSRQARLLPDLSPPVWTFLPGRQNGISATSIRQRGGFGDGAGHATVPNTLNSGE